MKNIIFFLISILGGYVSEGKEPNTKPTLVVGLVIDQMRYDYLYRFYDKFSENGFKRLMKEGFNCKNTHYHYSSTFTGPGHAHIFNGSAPFLSGIVSNTWFDRASSSSLNIAADTSVRCVGSQSNEKEGFFSPKNLLVNSISDQLFLSSNFRSKSIGIALKNRSAIFPVGHTGKAYWFSTDSGNWITSTYYEDKLPDWIEKYNQSRHVDKYLSSTWEPLPTTELILDDVNYENPINGKSKAIFPYKVNNRFSNLLTTPFGNTLTKEFAIKAIEEEKLGLNSNITDLISISFSVTDYVGHATGTHSTEIEDIYIRLDKEIADLLEYLDKKYGNKKYLLFLTSDHGVAEVPALLLKNKIPSGIMLNTEIANVISSKLQKTYGSDEAFLSLENAQIYMNHEALRKNKLSLDDVFEVIKDTLKTQEGINDVINFRKLNFSSLPNDFVEKIKNSYYSQRSGDFMLLLNPSWIEGYIKGTTHGTLYSYDTHIPLIWLGTGIDKGSTTRRVLVCDIASTIAQLLDIQEPNGSIGNPIIEIFQK